MHLNQYTLGPNTFERHLLSAKQRRSKGRRMMMASLMLTPMVDMFSLLVIFLLQAFSTSPELIVAIKGQSLPIAATGKDIKDAPVLAIANEGVYLDQKFIAPVEQVLKQPAPLMKKLEELRVIWEKSHKGESFEGVITLQAHKTIPSHWVAQLMAMLPSQYYSQIQLSVISGNPLQPKGGEG